MGGIINKQSQICGPHFFTKSFFLQDFNMHRNLYLLVSDVYGSTIHCLNMVKKYEGNNFGQKIQAWYP